MTCFSVYKNKIITSRAGFEPARGDPIGFLVQRLNHSAIATTAVLLTFTAANCCHKTNNKFYDNIFLQKNKSKLEYDYIKLHVYFIILKVLFLCKRVFCTNEVS